MEQLNQFKKISPMVAGIALIIYAVIGFVWGVSLWTALSYVAILAVGITCFIDKTEIIRVIALLILAVLTLLSTVGAFFNFVGAFFSGYLGFFAVIRGLVSFIPALLEVVAFAAMAAFIYMSWKSIENILLKFWYIPAGLVMVSVVVSVALSFVTAIVYSGFAGIGLLMNMFVRVIVAAVLAVGFAALGLSIQSDEKTEKADVVI